MILEWLLENGFVPDGHTDVTVIRGSIQGGRTRLKKDSCFVTVGPRTTCVYRKESGRIIEGQNFDTKDFEAIIERIGQMSL